MNRYAWVPWAAFDQTLTAQSIYEKTPLLQPDTTAAESVLLNLEKLTATLQDESRSPQPHPCLEFVAVTNLYQPIGRMGAVAQHDGVVRATVGFFAALLESEDDELLEDKRFSKALMTFVDRTCGAGNLYVGEETEGEIVELLFGVAAKMRLRPELLRAWFITTGKSRAGAGGGQRKDFIGVTSKEDFPLCYQLIDHVHHEGRIGDFARTGLLYVFETASKSQELERWIVESDLPTLMASGLGALYSQLSRKLSIIHPNQDLPVVLQLSDYLTLEAPREAESMYSEYLQVHLATFLSYLTFWQDVLEHCTSIDVKQTLLDHFQILFLQQLLYPSPLESSDIDGGSSVAVLTYLKRILEALDHPDFVHLILQYLLALPEPNMMESSIASLHAVKKRKSLLLLAKAINDDEEASPTVFNLSDLLQSSIRSENTQTVVAALKLITVLLQKNHPYAVGTMIRSERVAGESPKRTHGGLNAEIAAYVAIAADIGGESGMDEAYENYCRDCLRDIERHCCSAHLLTLESLGIPVSDKAFDFTILNPNLDLPHHTIQNGDRFFERVFSILDAFLTNNVEINLGLTEVFLALLSCPQLALENWAAVNPHNYRFEDSSMDLQSANEELNRLGEARREPSWSAQNSPLFLKAFGRLFSQISSLRTAIPSLTQLINTRKQAFRLHDEISEAIINSPPKLLPVPRPQDNVQVRPPTPQKPSSSFQARLFGRAESPSGRSSSPRGRSPMMQPDFVPGSHPASPSPNPRARSFLSSPARRPAVAHPAVDARPVVVGHTPEDLLSDIIEGANSEVLARKIRFEVRFEGGTRTTNVEPLVDAEPTTANEETSGDEADETTISVVSLSHVLTNIVILQEFILEVAAVIQTRASLLGEIRFN